MGAKCVTVADLQVGLLVEYLGDESETGDVLGEHLRATGMALYPGHPGQIWRATVQHVQVSWVGLEDEPASFMVGFSCDAQGTYAGLGQLSAKVFERRREFFVNVLATDRELFGWTPPWSASSQGDD